jgi:hypothetical protein
MEMAIQHFLLQNKEAVLQIRDPVPFDPWIRDLE